MLLDEIISKLNEGAEAPQKPQNEPTAEKRGNSKLSYSEEFWSRFGKSTTAPEERTEEAH